MASSANKAEELKSKFGQIVLVFQGGGALGAYQAGVYEALHEAGIEPDWLIGTSIGAINATIIAGNKPEDRLAQAAEFWRRVEHSPALEALSSAALDRREPAQLEHARRRNRRLLQAQSAGLPGLACAARARRGRLLLDRAAGGDAQRTRRLLADRQVHAAPHRRRRQGAHERDALFRQPRHAAHASVT